MLFIPTFFFLAVAVVSPQNVPAPGSAQNNPQNFPQGFGSSVNCRDPNVIQSSLTLSECQSQAFAQTTDDLRNAYIQTCVNLCEAASSNNGGQLPPGY